MLIQAFAEAGSDIFRTCYEISIFERVILKVEEHRLSIVTFNEFMPAIPHETPFFEGGV